MKLAAKARASTWIAFGLACTAQRKWPRAVGNVTILIAALLGIAHGAADDTLVAARLAARPLVKPLVTTGYAAAAASTFLLGYQMPKLAAPLLTALTWYHFGAGDAAFATLCGAPQSDEAWILRGAIPVAGSSRARALTTLVALSEAYRALRHRRFGDAVDLALLSLGFSFADSQQTFLAYFALWHSPRHIALVLERYGEYGSASERLRRFIVAALPNSLLALLAGLLVFVLKPCSGMRSARALILAITVPHLAAVAWLERRIPPLAP